MDTVKETALKDKVDSQTVDSVDTDKVTHMHDPQRKKTAYEILLEYYEEHQDFPGYRDLGEWLGVQKILQVKLFVKLKNQFKKSG